MLDYCAKLTAAPASVTEEDLAPMRAAGLTDADILDVCLIASYFAYVNRLADGLGVSIESEDDSKVGW
jgi:alkylhydroperoxidase family enzyme